MRAKVLKPVLCSEWLAAGFAVATAVTVPAIDALSRRPFSAFDFLASTLGYTVPALLIEPARTRRKMRMLAEPPPLPVAATRSVVSAGLVVLIPVFVAAVLVVVLTRVHSEVIAGIMTGCAIAAGLRAVTIQRFQHEMSVQVVRARGSRRYYCVPAGSPSDGRGAVAAPQRSAIRPSY